MSVTAMKTWDMDFCKNQLRVYKVKIVIKVRDFEGAPQQV